MIKMKNSKKKMRMTMMMKKTKRSLMRRMTAGQTMEITQQKVYLTDSELNTNKRRKLEKNGKRI